LSGVTRIVPNLQKDNLVAELLGLPNEFFDLEPFARQPLPGPHQRTRAFIKAQDGCDNACTYCITTQARGASRSRPMDNIITDVSSALHGGTREIVLTGVQLGAWGLDFQPVQHLSQLVSAVLDRTPAPRVRLSSLEPWDLDVSFFRLWSDTRLCSHLHLPLQSGSEHVLRRMARKTTPKDFIALVQSARVAIPQVAITTDIIAGFPGETDEEFAETLEFIRSMHFAGGHVFSYSARPGTPAARMQGQVDHATVKTRCAILRVLLDESALEFHREFIGKTMPVLWEAASNLTDEGWQIEGLTGNYLRVTALAPEPRWNQIDSVFLTTASVEGLRGEIQR
jgi:threonylcarbamoyladenosine tRNA methylthiotransferase MtaB